MPFSVRYTATTLTKGANVMTTYHALQRTSERTGLSINSSQRFITNALERGRQAADFTAKEREYLQRRETEGKCRTVVYNSYCLIVGDGGCCITMFPLPKWFGKKLYDGKQEVRNARKYIRYCDYYEQEDIEDGLRQVS